MNKVGAAVKAMKEAIISALGERHEAPCTFIHAKREIKGAILNEENKELGGSAWPFIYLRSHTGNVRAIRLDYIVTVDGVNADEI